MNIQFSLALRKIKTVCDYQFGPDITSILFNTTENLSIERSKKTKRIRYIYLDNNLLLTIRPTNGLFTLSFFSADLIIENSLSPRLRAVVLNEISKYIKMGRNVFCKHIINIDERLRPMDEIIVVNQDNELLAIGRLIIPIPYVKDFKTGLAINVRKGIDKLKVKNRI